MPAFKGQLTDQEIDDVATYVVAEDHESEVSVIVAIPPASSRRRGL